MKTTVTQIDTTTSEGFRAGRQALGVHPRVLGQVLDINERTIKRWESGEGHAPHPSAAAALRWMLYGYRPNEWPADRSPEKFREARDRLAMSQSELAEILDVDDGLIGHWESEGSAPAFVWRIIGWLESGFRPAEAS